MGCRVAASDQQEEEAEQQRQQQPPPETMPFPTQKPNPKSSSPSPSPSPSPSLKKRWSDLWLKKTAINNTNTNTNTNKNPLNLKHVVYAMKLQSSLSSSPKKTLDQPQIPNFSDKIDRTLLLSDETLLRILSKLPRSQRSANSLVCTRWLSLQDRLVRSLKLLDWNFLLSGRLTSRFPNLTHVDLLPGSLISVQNADVLLNRRTFSVHLNSHFSEPHFLPVEVIDRGLTELASGCPNLRKLSVISATELGLLTMAEECSTLQDLELHRCSDNVLRGIAACGNLQVLRLVGCVDGFYGAVVSDIGLTILAQGCKRLVKLELSGCEGSFDGIKAIGQCCQMLEELIICDHRMESGWLAGLSYCENLKTLKFVSCNRIDVSSPGPGECFGVCPALERLHLQKCQVRDKKTAKALFVLCGAVREIVFQDCWGLENDVFSLASHCRRVKFISLEGCSLVTTDCLETVILCWKEIESLRVEACKNIKDKDISSTLSALFSLLKELKWRPDTKSRFASSAAGTSIGKKGGRFFRRILDHKLLHFDQSLLHF